MDTHQSVEKVNISRIELNYYRNFEKFQHDFSDGKVLIIGENGAGKTNILESISLMSIGRGLKYTKFDEICKHNNASDIKGWKSNINFRNDVGLFSTYSMFDLNLNKRIVHLNDEKISVKDLTKFINIIWITPDMHHIFTGPRITRLKFLDRMTYSFFPNHASIIKKYDHYIHERRSLLKRMDTDKKWINMIEKSLSELTIDIVNNRMNVINIINNISPKISLLFPTIFLELKCDTLEYLELNREDAIEKLMEQFINYRNIDLKSGKSNFGLQRADFIATHLESKVIATYCSMGQQKAVLVSIILAQVFSIIEELKRYPIILLDEVFIHLDNKRSEYLSEILLSTKSQVWVTDTDTTRIKSFSQNAQIVKL